MQQRPDGVQAINTFSVNQVPMPMQKRPERAQEKIKIKKITARAHMNTTLPVKVFRHNQLSKSLAEY